MWLRDYVRTGIVPYAVIADGIIIYHIKCESDSKAFSLVGSRPHRWRYFLRAIRDLRGKRQA